MNEKLMVSVISSITGFHNPKIHHGLKPKDFLLLYKNRLQQKKNPIYKQYLEAVITHEYYFLAYIDKNLLKNKRLL